MLLLTPQSLRGGRDKAESRDRSTLLPPTLSSSLLLRTQNMTTVIDHIVLFKVKSDASNEQIKNLIDGVQSLRAIPGVLSITIGSTFVEAWMPDRRQGYTHALCCRLESKNALQIYQDHPLHDTVKKDFVFPILAEPPIAVDYESVVVLGSGGK